jgi:hypothetical protein
LNILMQIILVCFISLNWKTIVFWNKLESIHSKTIDSFASQNFITS